MGYGTRKELLMWFDTPVKIKGKDIYHYEINIDESYDQGIVDEWGAAYVWNKHGVGAEYNIYFDGQSECSAIYKMDEDSTDPTTYEHYEIDFSEENWKEKLIDAMIKCVDKWWDSDDTRIQYAIGEGAIND